MAKKLCDDCARWMCALVENEIEIKCNCTCHK